MADLETQVMLARMVLPERLVDKERRVHREPRGNLVSQDQMDCLVTLVMTDPM